MFPKGKTSSVPSDNQAREKLATYVHEYLIHMGAPKAAQTFLQEIHFDKNWIPSESPGFLYQWWGVFFDLYSAAPERRETFEHSSEAKAFHDYGFVNSGYPNGLSRNPSIPSPISGGMPPAGGRPPSSQGIIPPDNGIHTPVSIPGGQMVVQGGHFFPPNHGMSNLGGPGMEMMRNRAMMHPIRFAPGGPMVGNYHPGAAMMPRHRFNQVHPSGLVHSPGPSGTPQTGPVIMASPGGDGLQQNDGQQNTPGQDSFNPNNGSSSRSPSQHGLLSQPAPAFPPPPASETGGGDQQQHPGMMNGGQVPFSQQQSHTMEYMPAGPGGGGGGVLSFEAQQAQMKHSPQLQQHDVLSNGIPGDFCGGQFPPLGNDHPAMRGGGGMPSLSQMHLMQQQQQQGLGGGHHVPLSMQSMAGGPGSAGGGPGGPPAFMGHPGIVPISASPQFPDYGFTSMSQTI